MYTIKRLSKLNKYDVLMHLKKLNKEDRYLRFCTHANDDYIENTSGNTLTLVLPSPANVPGKFMFIRNTNGAINITPSGTMIYGTNTISSATIANGDTKLRLLVSTDASRWIYQIIGD